MEADAPRDVVRGYALETSAEPDAVPVVDGTGFLNKGKASRGVGRRDTGTAGKITNRRGGVFAAYVSDKGHASIDRALYSPEDWTKDPDRMRAAHVPEGVGFATEPRLALDVIERAIAADAPFAWVAADTVYGTGEIEMALRRAGEGYVLGTDATRPFQLLGGQTRGVRHGRRDRAGPRYLGLAALERGRGHRGRAAARLGVPGTGRPRRRRVRPDTERHLDAWLADPARHRRRRVRLLQHVVPSRSDPPDGPNAEGRPGRRATGAGTGIEGLVAAEGRRWAIEDAFETAETELGLDRNETRSWHGWHRHVSPVMLAFAMLAIVRHLGRKLAFAHANQAAPPKTAPRLPRVRLPSSIQEVRRVATRLAQRRIRPSYIIAWSLWRRTHQAAARRSHLKRRAKL